LLTLFAVSNFRLKLEIFIIHVGGIPKSIIFRSKQIFIVNKPKTWFIAYTSICFSTQPGWHNQVLLDQSKCYCKQS